MLRGHWRNEVLGSGTDRWKYWDDKRAGLVGDEELSELERGLGSPSPAGLSAKTWLRLGCTTKTSSHTGPAVVFDDHKDLKNRINDPSLGITEDSVLVLRKSGPLGGPGMPEYGMPPLPDHLPAKGVRDRVRVSDARMSGTGYGACVLHVAPESPVGGPLALVRGGDPITLDVPSRRLSLDVDDAELQRRRARWNPPAPRHERGYGALYAEHITQADEGFAFDFLAREGENPEPDAQ
ncbi:dihydroxy-acid dehydratase [Amycolatopsis sp. cmx-4-54]|uniref:dihydroxy-acid dehydratase domain-containing protein n=1 Tax=Amycolatopsis sp. cmx-4-54 TaxID=2790936 RepID=UPI00397E6D79